MAHRLLRGADAFWRPSNQMSVLNTDLAEQLEAGSMGARLWRLAPARASHPGVFRVDADFSLGRAWNAVTGARKTC
jgi:hypothetical protein